MIKKYFTYTFLVIAFLIFLYFLAIVGKYLSYKIFYEDNVIETINNVVKESCIK